MCSKISQAFLIAGTHSGSGKTTITIGLLSALKERGLRLQSFKAGPDFIDPGIHGLITGKPGINLDLWLMGEKYVEWVFNKYSSEMDLAVVEGVMGLFDGSPSTADLATYLGLPVLLVIDTYAMAESLRPVVRGYMEEAKDRGVELAGLIFNRTGGEEHYKRLKESIKDFGIEVIGHLPRDDQFSIPSRHLGLYRAEESPLSEGEIKRLTKTVTEFIDIDRLLSKVRLKASPIHQFTNSPIHPFTNSPIQRIGIARDRAFSFYYRDMIEGLEDSKAEIVEFSPLNDRKIPEGLNFIYIGGGYPELYASGLSENQSMIESIRRWVFEGRPLYAECGGLIYLSKGIYINNTFYPMAGIFPFITKMQKRPVIGYRVIENTVKGEFYRGHEFHYSVIEEGENKIKRIFKVFNKESRYLKDEGFLFKRTLASYVHIHNIMPVIKGLMEDSWTQ
ncbi:MAG: cobyrinate a,c-diamide synthase [Thermodesulfovibrionales bacterium]